MTNLDNVTIPDYQKAIQQETQETTRKMMQKFFAEQDVECIRTTMEFVPKDTPEPFYLTIEWKGEHIMACHLTTQKQLPQ